MKIDWKYLGLLRCHEKYNHSIETPPRSIIKLNLGAHSLILFDVPFGSFSFLILVARSKYPNSETVWLLPYMGMTASGGWNQGEVIIIITTIITLSCLDLTRVTFLWFV